MSFRTCFIVALAGIAWSCVLGLQRPAPRYSQQDMPDTSFSCHNKIVGSYYADPETDCQLFHVCVSVAGSIQDYKFLCPNDTAFDQESQTCADWYDVDCEAATLYYASDNFDLYRLGSGLESLHYDSVRSDAEPQDNLQRSETSDAVRSSANSLNRASTYSSSTNDNSNANSRDILRGSSSINFYNSRNGGKDEDYDSDKAYKDEAIPEPRKKSGVRKTARKQQQSFNNNYASSSTVAPVVASSPIANNYNGNYNNYNRQRSSVSPSSTTLSTTAPENYNVRNQNNQKYNVPTTTYRPSTAQQTFSTYQPSVTTVRTTAYNNNNNNNNNAYNTNSQQHQTSNSYGQSIVTSPKPTSYSPNYPSSTVTTPRTTSYNQNYQQEQQNYKNQYPQFGQSNRAQSTTVQPTTNYQTSDYTNYQRSYNNLQRSTNSPNTFPTTIAPPTTFKESYNSNHAGNTYAPTTYKPLSNSRTTTNDNKPSANNPRINERYNSQSTTFDDGQYHSQPGKSGQYYDLARSTKKAAQYTGSFDATSNSKYHESSTGTYDIVRSQAGVGFSPSSINHLAETPRSTTPVPKRTGSPTTYNPQSSNHNNQRQTQTTPRGTTYVSPSARPFSTTPRSNDPTTPRPKLEKKNDYDYAYYDNVGGFEYDGLDLEHVVAGNKESSKISRN